ncbi:hypothetical protein HS088_TW15G00729 [Tripterygium wilfordii]|uniref:Small EDRK-rich factor-like N-terminal domain-containing protein n=1 Tax=Tripterygium wilfordii TaxID=458696 RepID=A0A7J7CMH2_TRIWF|nr:hypothetical protein HS088_TW15G00729 [Tripterygium wilfordii]
MTRGKQKIEAQRRNAEKDQKAKGSQLEARAVCLKVVCPSCKTSRFGGQPADNNCCSHQYGPLPDKVA